MLVDWCNHRCRRHLGTGHAAKWNYLIREILLRWPTLCWLREKVEHSLEEQHAAFHTEQTKVYKSIPNNHKWNHMSTLKVLVVPSGWSSRRKTASFVSGLTSMSWWEKLAWMFLSLITSVRASAYFLTTKMLSREELNITVARSLLPCWKQFQLNHIEWICKGEGSIQNTEELALEIRPLLKLPINCIKVSATHSRVLNQVLSR